MIAHADRRTSTGLIARDLHLELAGRSVLAGVDANLSRGELLAVIGPNGAGKSSLLKVLAGQRQPASGTVTLDGTALSDWNRRDLAQQIAYVAQERVVHWPMPVADVVALGRLPYGGREPSASPVDQKAIETAIGIMDLAALRDRAATRLSGGELVRVLIARALAQETPYILADEPVAGLDPAHQIALFERFRSLVGAGRGIAVALHDLSLAARYCDRVLVLDMGKVAAFGPAAQVIEPNLIRRVYGVEAYCGLVGGVPAVLPLSLSNPGDRKS